MTKVTEFLFTTKKFGNTYSEINQFLQYLRSEYVDYVDFEILENDNLSTISAYGIRQQVEDDLKKSYIVVCESWEYNDEYYYQPEDEGYTLYEPKLYTKDEAETICAEMNNKSSEYLTRWDDDLKKLLKIQPYKIIKLEI